MQFAEFEMEDYVEPSDESIAKGHLRFELCWTEVARGLGLILRGYVLLIVAAALLAGGVAVFLNLSLQERAKIPWQLREVGLWLGVGLFGLVSLYCYGCLIVGHWRCLMHVPERRGARWLIFACLTCILAGPGLNLASNLTGVEKGVKWQRGVDGIKELRMTKEGTIMQVGSVGVQVLGTIFFILFLRAVVACFGDRLRVLIVDVYLVLSILLLVATLYLAHSARDFEELLKYALVLGGGWMVNFLAYLVVIGIVRNGITRGLTRLATPATHVPGQSGLTSRPAVPLN